MQDYMEILYNLKEAKEAKEANSGEKVRECLRVLLQPPQTEEDATFLDIPKGTQFVLVWAYKGEAFSDVLRITKEGYLERYLEDSGWEPEIQEAYQDILKPGNYVVFSVL